MAVGAHHEGLLLRCVLILHMQAADLAIEDAVLALDKAMLAGLASLPLDVYLKQARARGLVHRTEDSHFPVSVQLAVLLISPLS